MNSQIFLQGKYLDRLKSSNGSIRDFGWRSNIIVDQCRYLLAAFMKGEAASGIQYIELGRGDVSWDLHAPEAANMTIQQLVDDTPIQILLADLEISFLDITDEIDSTPSERIQVALSITADKLSITGDQVYPLREFALFGKLGTDNYMIDYVRHPVINIAVADTLDRKIRLVF